MIFTFVQRAEPGTVFAQFAFDYSVGKPVPIRLPDGRKVDGKLIGAKVAEDGMSVELTCEVDDSSEVAGILNPRHR